MPATVSDRLYGLTTSVAVKPPCKVGTTGPVILFGLQAIDGVALSVGDRVLVKDQVDATENGIYTVQTTQWVRAPDFDGARDAVKGTLVICLLGTGETRYWEVTTPDPVRIGFSAITFAPSLISDSAVLTFLQQGVGAVQRPAQSKMRERISITDFGAQSGLAFDSSKAIELALLLAEILGCATVHFPGPGPYRITRTITQQSQPSSLRLGITADPGVVLYCDPPSGWGNAALQLEYLNIRSGSVSDLTIECNNKMSAGLYLRNMSDTTPPEMLFARNVKVSDCMGKNNAGVVRAPAGIYISAGVHGGLGWTEDCIVDGVSREVLNPTPGVTLSCTGIAVIGLESNIVRGGTISRIFHGGASLQDADGVKVYAQRNPVTGAYARAACIVEGVTIRDCEGRYVKTQTRGMCSVTKNTLHLDSALTLINDFMFFDSQIGDVEIRENKLYVGDAWTGGASARLAALQPPIANSVSELFELFSGRFNNNTVFVKKRLPYGIVVVPPATGVQAVAEIQVSDNRVYRNTDPFGSYTPGNTALGAFIYVGDSLQAPAAFSSRWVWDVDNNEVSADEWIITPATGADYSAVWELVMRGNTRLPLANSASLLRGGRAYTSRIRASGNAGGQGRIDWPVDAQLALQGCDYYQGSPGLVNGPASNTFGRFSKTGVYQFDRGTTLYSSADAVTWRVV